MENEKKSITVTLRIPQELYKQVALRGKQENIDFSKSCRRLLEKGVSIGGYKDEADFIAKIVRDEVKG